MTQVSSRVKANKQACLGQLFKELRVSARSWRAFCARQLIAAAWPPCDTYETLKPLLAPRLNFWATPMVKSLSPQNKYDIKKLCSVPDMTARRKRIISSPYLAHEHKAPSWSLLRPLTYVLNAPPSRKSTRLRAWPMGGAAGTSRNSVVLVSVTAGLQNDFSRV